MPYLTSLLLLLGSLLPLATVSANDEESRFLEGTRQLTFEGRRAGEGYYSADGAQLIFQSERDPQNPFYQIFLMDLETGDVEQMSPGHGKTTCAWIHPEGDRVLYASTHDDPRARDKMREEIEFRESGQQRRYSWDYDEHFEVYAHDLDTGARTNLTNALGYDAEGSYSPDGQLIAFASNRRAYNGEMSAEEAKIFEHDPSYMMDLYLMNADGSDVRRLTDSPGYDGGPFFSPDGSQITWRRFSEDGATAEIFTMDLATGEERQLTNSGYMSWAPYFHPSGDYLIFASNEQGFANFELYLVDAAGANKPVRVTFTDGFDGLPVFSPDGQHLAWTSNRTAENQSQIFLAKWNDAAAREALGLDGNAANAPVAVNLEQTEGAITAEDAEAHLLRLTAEDMEGRLTGTPGARLATDYVAGVFAALGLAPGGDDGSYFQSFPFTAGATLGASNKLSVHGAELQRPLKLNEDWRPLALSMHGEVAPADIVFAGYGIVAPEAEGQPAYDSYGDLDVEGKWVMMLRFQPEDVTPERRRHLLRYAQLEFKASWARRKGALGMIVVTGPTAAAKSELVDLQVGPTTQTTSLAAVSVSNQVGASILSAAGFDLEAVQKSLDDGETVEQFALPGVSLSANLEISRETRQGRNVIGVLAARPASTLAPVVLGAHVDHLGRGESGGSLARGEEEGQVHPGADDNASGVAGMLEAAQYLADLAANGKLDARRDIWFVAWSGEELGTLGSSYFVEQFINPHEQQRVFDAYLNMDMIGRLQDKLYLQGTGSSTIWDREIERRNAPVGLSVTTSSDPYLPTDSTPFYMNGIPVLAAFTGVHEEYSTPRDVPGLINFQGIRDVTRLMAGITRSLARSQESPDYVEVSREAQGGGRAMMRVYLGTIPAYGEEEGIVGVRLQGAVKDSPAELAGIQPGDILVELGGMQIETIYDFVTALGGLKADQETGMAVEREGERVEMTVVPGSRE